MIMLPPNDTTKQNLNGKINHSAAASDTESNVDLLETFKALWLVLVSHVEATVDGLRLDIKLAASSLMALLVTGIVVAALLVGLWFLGMGLLYAGLVALQVPAVVALLAIVLIQFLLLFFCHRFAMRMLQNLNFQAVRSALSDTSDPELIRQSLRPEPEIAP